MPYKYKPYGSGWFDCCEPREPICPDRFISDNQFNDGPPSCEPSKFDGFFGKGLTSYNECGWAATQGWTFWKQDCCYLDEPRGRFDEPECEEEVSVPFNDYGGDANWYPSYDPCSCDVLPT